MNRNFPGASSQVNESMIIRPSKLEDVNLAPVFSRARSKDALPGIEPNQRDKYLKMAGVQNILQEGRRESQKMLLMERHQDKQLMGIYMHNNLPPPRHQKISGLPQLRIPSGMQQQSNAAEGFGLRRINMPRGPVPHSLMRPPRSDIMSSRRQDQYESGLGGSGSAAVRSIDRLPIPSTNSKVSLKPVWWG